MMQNARRWLVEVVARGSRSWRGAEEELAGRPDLSDIDLDLGSGLDLLIDVTCDFMYVNKHHSLL